MIENLLNLVKEHAQEAILKNDAVPNQFNDAAINEASSLIQSNLTSSLSQGNLQDVLSIFGNSNNLGSNPLVGNIVGQLAGNLGSKFGVQPQQAQSIANSLIPMVMGQLANKTNNPNDSSFNINDLMQTFSGGKTQGVDFGNVLSQMQEGKGVDFAGLAGQFLGSNQQAGGLGGLLGGIFGK
jgi:hypothetical protein